MRFTKPAWVIHHDAGTKSDTSKRLSIFSVHVHPDGSRIATGGLDAKIRIWSTKPILNQTAEAAGRIPKSLCTLTMHTGPVLTVRWAHSGRWLASGSDDEIVMIWDLDPTGAGKVWGTDEVNVEGWKPLKRLPGHESDVTDVAWAPEDRYLASVGLDSMVFIWCGHTLERLHKLNQHQGFVKGVCWDPVGEFLATQSDDKSVKIWRTTDWGLEAVVTKPFEVSPGSTFFRRLSWSPDGAHITASNAMNNNGFVFVAAVITRNSWTSEISLVGHENTVEVAAYNPHIFLRNPAMPVVTSNICSVVALGADDRSISVWQTKSARPLIVAKEVFERQILDLSWSWDGLTLYAVSSDGTMAVFNFDPEEMEGIAPREAQTQYLQKFGFVPPPLPSNFTHGHPAEPIPRKAQTIAQDHDMRGTTPPPTPPPGSSAAGSGSFTRAGTQDFGSTSRPGEHVNVLVPKRGKKDKKRIQPSLVGGLGGMGSRDRDRERERERERDQASSLGNMRLPHPPSTQIGGRHYSGPADATMDVDGFFDGEHDGDFKHDMDVPISSLETSGMAARGSSKRRDSAMGFNNGGIWYDDTRIPKARTLGGDENKRRDGPVREIRSANVGLDPRMGVIGPGGSIVALSPPNLLTALRVKGEEPGDLLEGRNEENGSGPSEVTFFINKDVQWLDYLSSPVLALTCTSRFCAVATEDGCINVYSRTGRRLLPTIVLGIPCAEFQGSKNYLMALTTDGMVRVWNIKEQSIAFSPVSLVPLFSNSPNITLLSVELRPNGTVILQLSSGVAYTYDGALQTWVKVSEPWWSQGSAHWKSRPRQPTLAAANASGSSNNGNGSLGVVQATESRILELMYEDPGIQAEMQRLSSSANTSSSGTNGGATGGRSPWWDIAMTLGHLETKMHAARMLGSPGEFKMALSLYAKTIADEGFRGKAEELLRELYGPVYFRPGKGDETWSPTVVGLSKRDLVKDVLNIFVRSKTLFKLAQDYQELLKKSSNIDD